MAERKGLEPSASGVTGRRYNRLNYRSNSCGAERFLSARTMVPSQPVVCNFFRRFGSVTTKGRAPFRVLGIGPKFLAEWKGLEPSASGVTGRRYNRLNYHSACVRSIACERTFPAGYRPTCKVWPYQVVGGTGLEPVTLGL